MFIMNTQNTVGPVERAAHAFKGGVSVTNSILTRFRRHGGEHLRQDLERQKARCINSLLHLQPHQRKLAVEKAGFCWAPQSGDLLNAALHREAVNWQKQKAAQSRPFNGLNLPKVEVAK